MNVARHRSVAGSRAVLLGAAIALGGCEQPLTEIVVVVDSDSPDWARIEVEVVGFAEPTTVQIDLADAPLPRRFALVHAGGPLGPIAVTARAFAPGASTPALVEPRTNIHFVRDATKLLRIDLLLECIGVCAEGEACLAGPRCLDSGDAAVLESWTGSVEPLSSPGAGMDAGSDALAPDVDGAAASPDAGADAATTVPVVDSGVPSLAEIGFPYLPSNFANDAAMLRERADVDLVLDCGTVGFDSTSLELTGLCDDEAPFVQVIEQIDGSEAAVIAVASLAVDPDSTLRLSGSRPVILAVFGDARIDGNIDASASASTPGAGGGVACAAGAGSSGAAASGASGAGGGSGGGFGSAGAAGGSTGLVATRVDGGSAEGEPPLVPLRAGCAGGNGGAGSDTSVVGLGGGAGGAVQVSAAGELSVDGSIRAAGGGGGVGDSGRDGGAGGGSGGGILLEGETVTFGADASVTANGGSGGAGQPSTTDGSEPGADGEASLVAVSGGIALGSGGAGGDGGAYASPPTDGQNPIQILVDFGGGGGGGGAVGRIRVNGSATCTPGGRFSPAPSVECPACGAPCPLEPEPGCAKGVRGMRTYFLCSNATDWNEARRRCAAAQLHLAHVNGDNEDIWVSAFVGGEAWIGANDIDSEGEWRWEDDDLQFWSGASGGSAVGGAYHGWASGEPGTTFVEEDCVSVEADGWHPVPCMSSRAYLCESE